MKDEIHKALSTSETYDLLRQAHSLVKDILYAKNFESFAVQDQNAIESLSGVMYLVEKLFINF